MNVAANEISSSHNGIWLLLNKVKNSTDHKERLCEAHRFVKTSKLLLGLVTAYERNFNITPDSNTPDDTQIGAEEIYENQHKNNFSIDYRNFFHSFQAH